MLHALSCSRKYNGEKEGKGTGALLLNDAEGTGNGLAVGKNRCGGICSHAIKAVHSTGAVVRVSVTVYDANKDAVCANWELWNVGLGVFSKNETSNRSNGSIAVIQILDRETGRTCGQDMVL